jgi:hypothetical protein
MAKVGDVDEDDRCDGKMYLLRSWVFALFFYSRKSRIVNRG